MARISEQADQLLRSLWKSPPLLDRLRGNDPRRECLETLAASGEFRVVPELLPLLAAADSLSEDTARAIATLVSGIGPTPLAWIDEQVRRSYMYVHRHDPWATLSPAGVKQLVQVVAAYPSVIGLLASHPSGFVREAAVNELGRVTGGQEIPFLALRANDWVLPVAAKAAELLARRLVPENRQAVLAALPFIVRMLGQRRHDHGSISDAVRVVLLSDGGHDVLTRLSALDTPVRRRVFEMILSEALSEDSAVMRAALVDADAVVRRRAVIRLSAAEDPDESAAVLERVLSADPVPGVRKTALSVLAERAPNRARMVLPRVLLDPAARVRELAQFLVRHLNVPLVPRELYIESLKRASLRHLATAIAGLGETGTGADVDRLNLFFDDNDATPRVRAAALRASARLDVERGVSRAIAALADAAPSVRAGAITILKVNARRVDFSLVGSRRDGLDPSARRNLLSLLREAPKWDAAAFLLEALGDSEPEVRRKASQLLDSWVSAYNRNQSQPSPKQVERIRALMAANESAISEKTAELLRFSLKNAGS